MSGFSRLEEATSLTDWVHSEYISPSKLAKQIMYVSAWLQSDKSDPHLLISRTISSYLLLMIIASALSSVLQ